MCDARHAGNKAGLCDRGRVVGARIVLTRTASPHFPLLSLFQWAESRLCVPALVKAMP